MIYLNIIKNEVHFERKGIFIEKTGGIRYSQRYPGHSQRTDPGQVEIALEGPPKQPDRSGVKLGLRNVLQKLP